MTSDPYRGFKILETLDRIEKEALLAIDFFLHDHTDNDALVIERLEKVLDHVGAIMEVIDRGGFLRHAVRKAP
jgi:hypothetical protein